MASPPVKQTRAKQKQMLSREVAFEVGFDDGFDVGFDFVRAGRKRVEGGDLNRS